MPGFELIGQEERDAVNYIFDNGGIFFAHGFDGLRNNVYAVRQFESDFANKMNIKYAQAVSSGTAGLKIALKAVGVESGDEVITQAFNFISDVEAIIDCGATPIITNVDDSLNMCPIDLKSRITNKTKAIVVVHMLGNAANMDEIVKISKENNIPLIEDNCESLGATWNDLNLGTIADIGVFSFDMGKVITTGEGGMIVSSNEAYMKYIREYHDHGHENNKTLPRGRDTRSIVGFNYRMTELQGAIGSAQLKKLDYIVAENRKRYNILKETLQKHPSRLVFNQCNPLGDTFILKVPSQTKRTKILNYLVDQKIGTKNVPDAVEWHCAGFWDHALPKEEYHHAQKTKELLQLHIAIPIMVKKEIEAYQNMAKDIRNILDND